MIQNTELLAPAKDKQTAIEAINCGADAVYIGAPKFGARKNVPNTLEDIKEVVDYAHKFWAKVFITMNTILTDSELEEAVDLAKQLSEIGVDALIIQDIGLLNKLMRILPSLEEKGERSSDGVIYKLAPIHMSTQCDNYLPEKVRFFNEMGVSRVILARELSIEQIRKIHEENPNLELEAFVHGALCVSMSGQCYLSQHIGGRSANRGECAQPCRKKYTVETTDGEVIKKDFYALCLKDFNASNCLEDLKEAGICSFKIEGRLKDIGYVKNIVSYYRQKLGKGCSSGRSIYPFTPNPEKSFNRGFTEYFLKGRTDCFNQESPKSKGEYLGEVIETGKNWIKLKTNKNINPQDGIYVNGEGFAVNRIVKITPPQPSPSKEGVYQIYPNKPVKVKTGDKFWRNLDVEFEKELLKPVKRQVGVSVVIARRIESDEAIQKENLDCFTSFAMTEKEINRGELVITLTDEDGVTITCKLPNGEKANNPEKMKETFIKQFSKTGESDFYIEEIEIETELPFMPVSEINSLRRELLDKLIAKRIETYNNNRQWQKPMKYTKYFQKEVDYRANIHNKSAKEFYQNCDVKILEPSFESKLPNRQVELMRCKHCIKYALNMCKSPINLQLRDEYGKTYPLKFDCKNCEMSILSNSS
ncbi:U32 family peptidase [bacterium]|nr:U32 family peptidase [bacterium]